MPSPGGQQNLSPIFRERSVTQWTPVQLRDLKAKLERQLGPEYISVRPAPGGARVHYLEGWKAINLANELFGFDGWSSEIRNVCVDYEDVKENGRLDVGLSVIVRITLRDGTFHEDIGYGHIENAKTKYMAYDKCKKEATTDGLKRALRNFGNSLGNCLYDSSYIKQVTKVHAPARQFDPGELHRAPDVKTALEQLRRRKDKENEREQEQAQNTENTALTTSNSGQGSSRPQHPKPENLPNRPPIRPQTAPSHMMNQPRRPAVHTMTNESNTPNIPREQAEFDEMDFGSDLIEEYNEFDEYNIGLDDFDFEINSVNGEILVYPNNELNEAQNKSRDDTNDRQSTPCDIRVLSDVPPNLQNFTNAANTPQPAKPNSANNGYGEDTPSVDKVGFFSARVAEAVQKDEPLDGKAMFDVSFQSPSLRKTVDHSVSRPILRSAVTPRANYDNPRLNSGRMIGRPPDLGSSTVGHTGRPLLSVSSGTKRPGPSPEIAVESNTGDSGEEALKRQKI
ncbi:hypothetical protein V1512DRAFT_262589 [Lipomyces arxii]|uniref:uncharacterized protein n=1 Tax=Lipomyces arxii TaxID=56418 RepID=UPI0034CFC4AE